MSCIKTTVIIKNNISATVKIKNNISATVKILNSGAGSECPIIFNIDGGLSNTLEYPPINGLLNGGSS